MSLGQVRQKINSVDDKLKLLFDERMECSDQVADIKINEGDSVYKPLREKEIAERFAGDKEYLAFIKKIMQISRKRQYGRFFERVEGVSQSEKMLRYKKSILEDGILELKLKADETATSGLNIKDILSVISDTSFDIKKLEVKDGCFVNIAFEVGRDADAKRLEEALVLAYMLSEETI